MERMYAKKSRRPCKALVGALLATLAVVGAGSAASATSYGGPFSHDPFAPTPLSFDLGDNYVTGTTGGFISSYFSFDVAQGDELSAVIVEGASPAPDLTFFGLASGTSVTATPSSSVGLLGYTLYDSAMEGMNILPAVGASDPPGFPNSSPGATTFKAPLGSGTYSVWVVDGDGAANTVPFGLDFTVAAAPEPSSWLLLIAGLGGVGLMLRRARDRGRFTI